MEDTSTEDRLRSYLKRVTAELSRTRQRLREVEARDGEPIAIVGMACRYPGADSPAELWDLVESGRDTVSGFPRDRGWDLDAVYDPTGRGPGTSYIDQAGFLRDATGFDAGFFGISDDEALAMDPQQRVILETAWEALEHARVAPSSLRGTGCGVYVGAAGADYGPRVDQAADELVGDLYVGNLSSVIPGRIAYCLGLTGPALTVDVGSASSTVAIHLAVRALRSGECELALAGGVSVFATPGLFIATSRTRKLSPTARAKPFAEASDGNNYAEGAGMLVLERLCEARRRKHRVLALIRGTASNQSGVRNGLTSTNTAAASDVFRRALADARLDGADVDLVEGNSHGAPLAAPMEVQALQAVYGQGHRADDPIYLGSMKSNFGHASAASGVGGVIKLVMALRHRVMPKVLHIDKPTSLIDWSSGTVRLLTGNRAWTATDRPRRAAVSSFGIGGSNGHVILEEAPAAVDEGQSGAGSRSRSAAPWVLSAKSEAALRGQAAKLLSHLDSLDAATPIDVAYSLAGTRAHFGERAVVVAADTAGYARGLRALADGGRAAELIRGTVADRSPAFVFGPSGGNTDWRRQLFRDNRDFAAAVDMVNTALAGHLGWPPADFGGESGPVVEAPLAAVHTFAADVGLTRMLRVWGLEPEYTVGHSTGRVTAAYVAGTITLDEACALLSEGKPVSGGAAYSCGGNEEVPITRLRDAGVDPFFEFSGGRGAAEARDAFGTESARFIPVVSADAGRTASVTRALATAHAVGIGVDWSAFFAGSAARFVDLPTYAFQHKRFWLAPGVTSREEAASREPRD